MSFIRYLAVGQENIVSIVNTGKYRDGLPMCSESQKVFDYKENPRDCFLNTTKEIQKLFVLEVMILDPNNFGFLNPNLIKKILVCSEVEKKEIERLFCDSCSVQIIIKNDLYTIDRIEPPKTFFVARNLVDFPVAQQSKLSGTKRSQEDLSISQEPKENALRNRYFQRPLIFSCFLSIERLKTFGEHIDFIKDAFKRATKNILITTYGVNREMVEKLDLYRLVRESRRKGVKITIVNQNKYNIDAGILSFFLNMDVSVIYAFNHSKVLIVDNVTIVSGSFNWLSTAGFPQSTLNSSLVCRGSVSQKLITHFYTSLQDHARIKLVEASDFKDVGYELCAPEVIRHNLNNKSQIACLVQLNEHQNFIQESFLSAKERIIICSPFISDCFVKDINSDILRKKINDGVDIYFVFLKNFIDGTKLQSLKEKINSPKIHLIPMENIHSKTFIVDRNIICEGSFNWLSACRVSSYNANHETSIAIYGEIAENFISKFDKSDLGVKLEGKGASLDYILLC